MSSHVLESMSERDRRIAWERRRAAAGRFAWEFLIFSVAGAIGAGIGFTYGIDYGKAMAERRAAQAPRQGMSCKAARAVASGCDSIDGFRRK